MPVQRGFLVDYRPSVGIRIAPHFYNSDAECEAVIREIASLRSRQGGDNQGGTLYFAPGRYEVRWNGVDGRGLQVPSGIYIYQLRAGDVVQTRRMLLLR